jgi:hypothetical protein
LYELFSGKLKINEKTENKQKTPEAYGTFNAVAGFVYYGAVFLHMVQSTMYRFGL